MKLTLHTFTLPLRHPFSISRSVITEQRTLIVELSHEGTSGYGEATANRYYHATVEGHCAALEAVRSEVEACPADMPPEALWARLQPRLASTPFAQCALDEAAHDLWGKRHGQSVRALWSDGAPGRVASSYTLGIAPIDVMVAKLQEMPGWPIYKIKLGTDHDLAIVATLRRHTDAVLRVDANCAWDAEQTLRMAEALQKLGVEFIEQPMAREAWAAMEGLQARCALPLVADESCQTEADVARCAGLFAGVNVKLVKCGGLTPGRRMLKTARTLGLRTMVGCMTESTVGISSIAQLVPLVDWVDLDGTLLLAQDTAHGVRVERGQVIYPETAGCGATLYGSGGSSPS